FDAAVVSLSSEEEEEEEQVPTDGGTSAEAMQVPLEEDDELEEEEIINDENFLGKRPLDSPEAEEMPAMKRPRLLSAKGDTLDVVLLEAREPLSSINTQKIPPMLSPVHVQDSADLAPPSPEPPMLAPVAKSQIPTAKPLETKAFIPKTKTKTTSPGQKTKSPKTTPSPAVVGSPIRSPKTVSKEKKSPGRSKSPKSPKSPKTVTHIPQLPVRPETPNRTPSAAVNEKMSKEPVPGKQTQAPPDAGKPSNEIQPKRAVVTDKTIDDSINAVIARACAEREPDPFEFSSGSESEGDIFTSPKRISGSECTTPKASTSSNNFTKSTPLPLSGGTSSSDNSWTMDASIDEVVRKAKLATPSSAPASFPYVSSPSVSPPTPEPLHKVYEEKTKPPSSVEVKKKLKKELKTKLKKKEKQRDKEREKDKSKEKGKDKDKVKEKEKEAGKETKYPWKEFLKDEDSDPYKFKIKEFEEVDAKVRLKDGIVRKEKEKHKDKKKDREKGKKDKDKREKERAKEKGREDKVKAPPTALVLPPKDMALPLFSRAAAVRVPSLLPALSPMLPEKLFEEKEKPKEKERKKDKKEKKKKKEKEKEKEKKEKEREKEKKEREKREKEKEKHKHEKIKVEPVVPAPSPVIPRLTLRVGAGQDKIVISKVVSAPEAKPAPSLNRPKTPPPTPAAVPVHMNPTPLPLPLLPQATACPVLMPSLAPALVAAGSSKAPVRSVVTETVSTYVIRDESGNQIWICPGCNKPDDGSPMIGCDDCDDWYHWPCVGIMAAPPEEMQWFCPKCANKKKDKKHKKRKHRAH
ncbi:PREDICTED: transcription initiation factor TFIID subunit 3-like, partial [Chinchilla lanigera]|uniref:transcription initiation factor TFIID subunit 3-like n=1 Tax=Chinchilla lanigera TaxID=34839 RepID=UPI0006971083